MTRRLHAATILALLAAWPALGASGAPSDPLKIPGAATKRPAKPAHAGAAPPAVGTPPTVEAAPVAPVSTAAPAPAAAATAPTTAAAPAAPAMSEAQQYCQNIAAAAADARFAWQSKKLGEVETQIKQRLAELDTRQAEVKDILNRYNDALKRAKAGLVDIYAKMKPETAAAQIAVMDDSAAAAILSQLNPQKASAILNEIAPDRAVRLVTTMSALVPTADGKKS